MKSMYVGNIIVGMFWVYIHIMSVFVCVLFIPWSKVFLFVFGTVGSSSN